MSTEVAMTICEEVMTRPFVWGVNDCVTSAGTAFALMTGEDPVREVRGKWKTKAEAYRLLLQRGGWIKGFSDLFLRAGLEPGRGGLASVGVTGANGPGLVVLVRPGVWAGKSEKGMILKLDAHVEACWCLKF